MTTNHSSPQHILDVNSKNSLGYVTESQQANHQPPPLPLKCIMTPLNHVHSHHMNYDHSHSSILILHHLHQIHPQDNQIQSCQFVLNHLNPYPPLNHYMDHIIDISPMYSYPICIPYDHSLIHTFKQSTSHNNLIYRPPTV